MFSKVLKYREFFYDHNKTIKFIKKSSRGRDKNGVNQILLYIYKNNYIFNLLIIILRYTNIKKINIILC
jgi:hypothetical protein